MDAYEPLRTQRNIARINADRYREMQRLARDEATREWLSKWAGVYERSAQRYDEILLKAGK